MLLKRRSFINKLSLMGLTTFSPKVLSANDRINFGVIGVGGMGSGHLESLNKKIEADNIHIVAVSDVYQRRLNNAMSKCQCEGYLDYRRLLDRKDIDAVLIATPDHWHAKITIDALESGKHVYVEKPMTHTIEEALKVRDTVKRCGKVLQVGPQRTSYPQYWSAKELICEGKLGKVTWAEGGWTHNFRGGVMNIYFLVDENAGPHMTGEDYIDWDMWLGHKWGLAPKIPWNPEHFFRFRKFFRYNGGQATDLLYHYLAPLLIAIAGENGQYPYRVTANGGLYIEKDSDGRDVPDVFMMTVDYPGEYTISLRSVFTNQSQIPPRIYGRFGTIEFADEWVNKSKRTTITGNGDYLDDFQKMNYGYDSFTIPSDENRDLEGNFIDAIRHGAKLYCNVDLGCAVTIATCMAVEAYQKSKTLMWDYKNEKVIYT